MLLSDCWTGGAKNRQGFTITQTLPNGKYSVYIWEAEDVASNARNMNFILQGVTVASNVGSQQLHHWTKFGPYAAVVANGVLTLNVVRNTKGDPQISGLAIFR
jgi:hypothetical protein